MATRCVSFPPPTSERFVADVKEQVQAYFDTNQLSQKADTEMKVKTAVILAGFLLPYVAILSGRLPGWAMAVLCVVMGLAMAGIGFSIAHDAQHGAYSDDARVNTALGLVFDALGANGYMWRITHNVIHHTYTNIQGIDEDLEVSPLLRLSPHSEHKGFHRFQHLYALPAYSLSTINWALAKDLDYFSRRKLGPYDGRKHPAGEWALMLGSKVFFFAWSVALPMWLLPQAWWQVALGILTVHLVAGATLGIVFQLAHVVEDTQHPEPDEKGRMGATWMVHQMLTTANFCTGNRLLTWYVGGLNHQIEHHLFPKICSTHYPAISKIVRAVAQAHGVPYVDNPSFLGAAYSHWKMLRRLGQGERAPVAAVAGEAPLAEPVLAPAAVGALEVQASVARV